MFYIDSLFFVYDGITSESMGVYLVNVGNSGMKEEHFLGDREIIQEQVAGNDIPYIYGVNNKPLTINLTLSPLEGLWTTEMRSKIARWLNCGKFAEFYSGDDINKRYFLMYSGSSNLYTNSNQQGYITIQFQNISPYTFSPVNQLIWDESSNTGTSTRTFTNLGDRTLYPQDMWIRKVGAGDISIKNLSDGGRIFSFTGLSDGEEIRIQNQTRQIETSLSGTYRYDKFSGNYMRFVYGTNTLSITGKAEIDFRYRFEFMG